MNHFFPGESSLITSFPLINGLELEGAAHPLNSFSFTSTTLWAPGGYLKTAHIIQANYKLILYKTTDKKLKEETH